MTPERFQKIEQLCHSVLEREENQRAAFLKEACAGDDALRLEVESLLAHEKRAERFEESPALQAAKEQARPTRSLVGRQMGSYQVLSLLGGGGMGEVYRAKDTKLDREVAIKILLEAFAQDPERLARFEREAKVLAALNHPNLAAIYGL